MKSCTPLWREAHFEVKSGKARHSRTSFGSGDVKKVHAVLARSTLGSKKWQSTTCTEHFWKLRCRKIKRRCGAKYISKSKVSKLVGLGAFSEVEMWKKCAPLWREACLEVSLSRPDGFCQLRCRKNARCDGATHVLKSKRAKHFSFGAFLEVETDVEKVHAVVARSAL